MGNEHTDLSDRYTHSTIGKAKAWKHDEHTGELRECTPEEMAVLNVRYNEALRNSFRINAGVALVSASHPPGPKRRIGFLGWRWVLSFLSPAPVLLNPDSIEDVEIEIRDPIDHRDPHH